MAVGSNGRVHCRLRFSGGNKMETGVGWSGVYVKVKPTARPIFSLFSTHKPTGSKFHALTQFFRINSSQTIISEIVFFFSLIPNCPSRFLFLRFLRETERKAREKLLIFFASDILFRFQLPIFLSRFCSI